MPDDIRDSAVPFEDIIGLRAEIPLLTPQEAMQIAARESIVVASPYHVFIGAVPKDMTQLAIVRMVGGVPREQSMAIGRRRTVADFATMARQVWKMLLEEHEREAKP